MIQRSITPQIVHDLTVSNKVVILYGPRQVGKTTLARQVLSQVPFRSIEVNADNMQYNDMFSGRDLRKMQSVVGSHELLFIDEAQNIPDIGIHLKILHDSMPNLKILTTGSSSFELANKMREPLTGRTWTYTLYPIAVQELTDIQTPFQITQQTTQFMRFGMYPDVLQAPDDDAKVRLLRELAGSYLYKDVLQLSNIRHSDKLIRMLKLLAFQVGSPVSLHEIGKSLDMSHETVNHYIDLLEKGFILFRLSGFSRNLRKEVVKMNKIYFCDLGIRNCLIENFNTMDLRMDVGALWENFLILERRKKIAYERLYGNSYYWRTHTGAELDYVEERGGKLEGYEFKWKNSKSRPPATWLSTYPESSYSEVNKDNYITFIG